MTYSILQPNARCSMKGFGSPVIYFDSQLMVHAFRRQDKPRKGPLLMVWIYISAGWMTLPRVFCFV